MTLREFIEELNKAPDDLKDKKIDAIIYKGMRIWDIDSIYAEKSFGYVQLTVEGSE